ncbi:MAG: ASCH domain-containing protein [Pseudobdellovibrionaceae bacterium]
MKVLSIRQPWAWLIVNGIKDIENRNWRTHFRGPFFVHASRKVDLEAVKSVTDAGYKLPEKFDVGGIVGAAEIVKCVRHHESPWFQGTFGFVLKNQRPLPFYPCAGKLSFFKVEFDFVSIEKCPPPDFWSVETKVTHCNKSLGLDDQVVQGKFEEDGFYFDDRSELSWNWDIVSWRYLNERPKI